MDNFFDNENFHLDLDSLITSLDLDDDGAIEALKDDWEMEVEESTLEQIFVLKEEFVVNAILEQTDRWSERFPEDSDYIFETINKAIKESIDIEKMNSLIPKCYYANGVKVTITKQDLLEYIK